MHHKDVAIELIAIALLICIDIDTIIQHNNRMFVFWSIICVLFAVNLILYLRKVHMFRRNLQVLIQAIKNMYPFMFVVVMSYMIFAFIGMSLFGGKINSSTPEIYFRAAGSQLNRKYERLNWNDMLNSLTFLYTLQVGNQIPILVNMSASGRDEVHRDYSGLFFIAFIVLNEMVLFNLFIGNLIAISLNFFELEKAAQTLKKDQVKYNKYVASSVMCRQLSLQH